MAQFYRKKDDQTVYQGYDPATQQFSGGISSEEQAQQLGVIPDWEASWKPAGAATNITTITPDSLAPKTPIDLSEAPTGDAGAADVFVSGVTAQQKQDADAAAKLVEEAAKKKEAATQDITGLLTQLEGEGGEQLAGEQAAGIPGMETQIADISGQIGVLNAEYAELQSQYDQQEQALKEQPGMLMGHFMGLKARAQDKLINKKNALAAQIGVLQAQGLAIQGKQAAAQASVNRAIDLKYSGLRQQLETKKFLFDAIREDLTAAEAKQLKIQEDIVKKQEADLAKKEAEDKQIQQIMLGVAGLAPNDVLAQISAAGSVLEATQLASPFLAEAVAEDKVLSPTEAATLGVPYGTTEAQAAAMGITPARWKDTGGTGGGGTTSGGEPLFETDNGEEIDITTVAGIKRTIEIGQEKGQPVSRADMKSFLDENTKLTVGSIDGLLDEAYGTAKEDLIQPDQVRRISEAVINKFDNNYDEAIASIQSASTIDKKTITETARKAIIAEIKAIQAEERPWWKF